MLNSNVKGMSEVKVCNTFFAVAVFFASVFFSKDVSAQQFNCDGRMYFFRADSSGTANFLSYFSNYTTVPVVTDLCMMSATIHNALGANPTDMYLYYQQGANLKRLDANCNTTIVCSNMPSALAGDFDIT